MYLHKLVFSWQRLVRQCFWEIHWTLRRASNDFALKDLLKNVTRTLQMTPRESPNRLIQQWLKRKDTVCLQSCFLGYLKVSVLKMGKFLSSEYQLNSLQFKTWPNKQDDKQKSSVARSRTTYRALIFHAQGSAVAHYSHRQAVIETGLRTIRKWHCSVYFVTLLQDVKGIF